METRHTKESVKMIATTVAQVGTALTVGAAAGTVLRGHKPIAAALGIIGVAPLGVVAARIAGEEAGRIVDTCFGQIEIKREPKNDEFKEE